MASLTQFDLIEVVGTSGKDEFAGRGDAVIFGRQGNDRFRSSRIVGEEDQFFFGGSGADRYVIGPRTSAVIGDGFSSNDDTVRLSRVVFGSPSVSYLEVDQRHLVIFDLESNTGLWLLDWLNPARAVEHFEFANEQRTLGEDFSASVVRRQPGYLGKASLEEVLGSDAQTFRALTREAFARAGEIERTTQPELIQVTGTTGNDTLSGDARAEIFRGLAGSDAVHANGGSDRVAGGKGNDVIDGGAGSDDLRGGEGADQLFGGAGDDRLSGDPGSDELTGGTGFDTLFGGNGADRMLGGRGDDVVSGGRGNDALFGNAGADWLFGGDGADRISGGSGQDLLDGGPGSDVLSGDQGLDVLRGLEGNDVLDGGPGADTLQGDEGADLFVFSVLDAQVDVVIDFDLAENDRLDIGRLLPEFAPGDQVDAFVQLRADSGSTVLAVDPSGAGGPFQDVVRLQDALVDDLRPFQLGLPLAPTSVAQLDGTSGFRLQGGGITDRSGFEVSSAGDVNGDGLDDLLIGAAGAAHVVFGRPEGFPSVLPLIPLDAAAGFTVAGDEALALVGAAGDVDGDGLDDIVLGAPTANPGPIGAGSTYVVLGAAGASRPDVDVALLDGQGGFRIDGTRQYQLSGASVGGGDINGDGLSDIIIGALGGSPLPNVPSQLRSYVVFGNSDDLPSTLRLDRLDGSNGFRIKGGGAAVASAGDVNGDGHEDVLIGAPGLFEGAAFLVFGASSGLPQTFDLDTVDGKNGIRFEGAAIASVSSVSGSGDVNGDGFADMIIGAPDADNRTGEAYVVFGKAGRFPSSIDLGDLNGSNGMTIRGTAEFEETGLAVSGGGDVNGDGLDDIIIGAPFAASHGISVAGAVYVVYGKEGLFPANIDLARLRVDEGFRVGGASENEAFGYAVSDASDVNGDGFADVIAGTEFAGHSYVIFGGDFSEAVDQLGTAADDLLTGSTQTDVLLGAQGDDALIGNGGRDILNGGAGDDVLAIGDTGFGKLLGGTGFDTVRLDGTGDTLDLTVTPDLFVTDIEAFDLNGNSNNLVLSIQEVLNIGDNSNTLTMFGDATNAIGGDLTGATVGQTTVGGVTFDSFTVGNAELLVQTAVDTSGVVV